MNRLPEIYQTVCNLIYGVAASCGLVHIGSYRVPLQ